jgi:hypothetical protein
MTCVPHDLLDGRGLTASALTLALIHPSAWNKNSANFAFTAFSEGQGRMPTLDSAATRPWILAPVARVLAPVVG